MPLLYVFVYWMVALPHSDFCWEEVSFSDTMWWNWWPEFCDFINNYICRSACRNWHSMQRMRFCLGMTFFSLGFAMALSDLGWLAETTDSQSVTSWTSNSELLHRFIEELDATWSEAVNECWVSSWLLVAFQTSPYILILAFCLFWLIFHI